MMDNQNISQILAIMVTDIVSYTETMNRDEQKAWDYIKKQRDIIPSIVSQMNGHMFKEMGDGTYSKFKSAIDAVQCAVRINNEAIKQELPIKIGVHLGEVKDDGRDVIGTGVNIADRINSLATSNKIIISDDVWRQIRNQADMEATSMGKQNLKGYHESVEVYELIHNPDGTLTKKIKVTEKVTYVDEEGKKVEAESAKKEFIKKVAIFPFDTQTSHESPNNEEHVHDDESLSYLSYGFPYGCCISLLQDPLVEIQFPNQHELSGYTFFEKLNNFSKCHKTHVPHPLKKKIAKELHCDYFISGVLDLSSDNIEVKTKVYNANNGKQIAENILQNSNYFNLIDLCSIHFREAMGIPESHIEMIENTSFSDIVTKSTDTYKNYIDGIIVREYENNYNKACDFFKSATTNDPTCSLANFSYFFTVLLSGNEELKKDGSDAINSALTHIYKLPDRLAYIVKYNNYLFEKGKPDQAIKVVQMWKKQYPESIEPYIELAKLYMREFKYDKAIEQFQIILENHPTYYQAYSWICFYYRQLNDADNGLLYAEKYLKHYPSEAHSYTLVARCYKSKGDYSKAKEFWEQALVLEMDNVHYMVEIVTQEINLGNFTEASEQLEEALLSCKTDEHFYSIYETYDVLYSIQGRIKDAITSHSKALDYQEKFQNPLDTSIHRMIQAHQYQSINQKEKAIKIIDYEVKKTSHPFNLLGKAVGLSLMSTYSENKKDLETALNDLSEFKKHKKFPVAEKFENYANGLLSMINKDYEKAIELFKPLEVIFSNLGDILSLNLKCYNRNKDFKKAIEIGESHLEKEPYSSPSIILELTKSYMGVSDMDMANKHLTKLLSIWNDADEEYIHFKEAKELWKTLNKTKTKA